MEHGGVGQIGIAPVNPAGRNHPQRRFAVFHHPDLHRRGVGTQDGVGIEIEGVVHGPRRMVSRNIERLEVVEIVLHFRPLDHFETQLRKQLLDAQGGAGNGVQTTTVLPPSGQGHVHRLTGQPPFGFRRLQCLTPDLQSFLYRLLGAVDGLAGRRALFGGQPAKRFQLLGEHALLAQIADPNLVECLQITRRLSRGLGFAHQLLEFVLHDGSSSLSVTAFAATVSGAVTHNEKGEGCANLPLSRPSPAHSNPSAPAGRISLPGWSWPARQVWRTPPCRTPPDRRAPCGRSPPQPSSGR